MNNGDKPAFKKNIIEDPRGANFCQESFGLTKREYFAAMAMQGLCANSSVDVGLNTLANQAVQQADQLLKELDQ